MTAHPIWLYSGDPTSLGLTGLTVVYTTRPVAARRQYEAELWGEWEWIDPPKTLEQILA